MNTSAHLVNEDKLYSVIGKFFTDGNNLLLELIQNAQRAKAKHVSVALPWRGEQPFGPQARPEYLLRIEDDGRGIRDISALLGIAVSDWDASIDAQDPAGMGFLQLLALSERVHIQSRFGSLEIDSQRFLNNSDYRRQTLESIDKAGAIAKGTVITALMQKPWLSYLRSDLNWYRGHSGMELILNGEPVKPIRVKTLIKEAEGRKNLYHLLSFRQNTLFIEIGNTDPIVASSRSAVNWYGQMIPVYHGSGLASNWNVRYYYEVKNGTPLTPRYPDRSNLNYDDLYSEFKDYVNQAVAKILRGYFDGFPESARFSAVTNASLLSGYYEHCTETELSGLDLVPVTDSAIVGMGSRIETITRISHMLADGCCYHVGDLQVDGEYNLGSRSSDLKCYGVSEKVGEHLRQSGMMELLELKAQSPLDKLINLGNLMLELRFEDGKTGLLALEEAMLMDDWGNTFIFAEKETMVHELCDELLGDVFISGGDWTMEDMRLDLHNRIDEQLASSFGIIDPQRFDFIPRHHDIRQIRFEYGNLAVDYRDGSKRDFAVRS